jgi:hypothetical protein
MFRSAFLLLALTLLPALTHADSHLSWNSCAGEAGAASNRTFACNTNTGSEFLVGS